MVFRVWAAVVEYACFLVSKQQKTKKQKNKKPKQIYI